MDNRFMKIEGAVYWSQRVLFIGHKTAIFRDNSAVYWSHAKHTKLLFLLKKKHFFSTRSITNISNTLHFFFCSRIKNEKEITIKFYKIFYFH